MYEVGIRHRQVMRWTASKPLCQGDVNLESTDMYEFAPHLIILALGMIFSFIIFIFEKKLYKYNQTRYFNF